MKKKCWHLTVVWKNKKFTLTKYFFREINYTIYLFFFYIKRYFHEIFVKNVWEFPTLDFALCSVEKQEIHSQLKNISWN